MTTKPAIGHIKSSSIFVEWTVDNFLSKALNSYYGSPYFNFLDDSSSQFRVYLGLGEHKDLISIYLELHSNGGNGLTVTLGLLGSDRKFYISKRIQKSKSPVFTPLIKRSEILRNIAEIAPDGNVTFFLKAHLNEKKHGTAGQSRDAECQTYLYGAHLNEKKHGTAGQSRDAECQTYLHDGLGALSNDLTNLLSSGDGSDVAIKVQDREFRAHSQILTARSSVFGPMFEHDMEEKNTGTVNIRDCDPETFHSFLKYLYSGQMEQISVNNAINLYPVAEKYDVRVLKSHCIDVIRNGISVDVFCKVISLGATYNDSEIISFAKEFFVENMSKIVVTVQWLSFAKEYPVQSTELVIEAAQYVSRNRNSTNKLKKN